MKLRTRVSSSSPVKNVNLNSRKYEESSDWSLTSPISTRSTRSTRSSVSTMSSTRITRSMSRSTSDSRPSSPLLSPEKSQVSNTSDFDSETDEKESILRLKTTVRPLIIQDDESIESDDREQNDMIDIMSTNSDEYEESEIIAMEISDPTLQGLLEEDEIDLEATLIDDSDRKLYELAFNRAEMSNIPVGAHGGTLKNNNSNNFRVTKGTSTTIRQNNSTSRGKGKDLFSVLKQRVRGPTIPSIRKIYFGTDVAINPWYSAPYPSEYHTASGELWICEFCLQYMKKPCQAQRHLLKCHGCLPPGDEIYRDSTVGISVFEINGRDAKLYCQNLCLLAKMFLDHKTLYYDVDPFLFYVLIEWKSLGTGRFLNSFVGYFSKEKINPAGYNVSCILTMPHHQRKGYGSFLIDFSYLLSRKEGRLGSPEKPLSDLGLFSYVSYWKTALLSYFSNLLPVNLAGSAKIEMPTLAKISAATGMTENDILSTLEYLRMLRFDIITDPLDSSKQALVASILIDLAQIEAYRTKVAVRKPLVAHEEYLRWHPYKCTK